MADQVEEHISFVCDKESHAKEFMSVIATLKNYQCDVVAWNEATLRTDKKNFRPRS